MLTEKKIYYGGDPATTAATSYDYDSLGRRTVTTDPANNTTTLTYNSLGQVTRRQIVSLDPLGSNNITETTDFEYDDLGRLEKLIAKPQNPGAASDTSWQTTEYDSALSYRIKETKLNGIVNITEYDAFGQKTKFVADSGGINQVTQWTYNRLGRQTSISSWTDNTDNNTKQTTTYDYDRKGNVVKITYPDTKTIEYSYNPAGTVKNRKDQRNFVTYYEYDGLNSLLIKSTDPDAVTDPNIYGETPPQRTVETFTYDGADRMLTAVKTADGNEISDTTFAYNDLGKLTDTWDKHFGAATARHVGYSYDQAGLLTSTTYPDGTVINRTNTWNGNIDTLSRSGSELVDYSYIGNRVACRAYNTATAVNADYSYDNLGRVTEINAGSSVVKLGYTYVANTNNIDQITFDHRTSDPVNNYDYDDIDRVTDIEYMSNTSDTESFVIDDLGNRDGNQTLRDDGTVNFTVDDDTNRYTSIAGNSISHDNAGNLTVDKDGYVHEYDTENRLIRIVDVNDVEIATFDYDALNRRIRKVDKIASNVTLFYYSSDWQVLAEYDGSGSLQRTFVYGNYIDEVLLMNDGSSDYLYLHDHLYSPSVLLNASGSVIERYEYDAYGKPTIYNSDFTQTRTTSLYDNPYFFTGRRLDLLDGGKYTVMYYRNRYYDTESGRFMQHDPFGYIDGMSLYEYVKSNPILFNDPHGTFVVPIIPPPITPTPTPSPKPGGPPADTFFWICRRKMKCKPYVDRHQYIAFKKDPWIKSARKVVDTWGFTNSGVNKDWAENPAACRACEIKGTGTLYGVEWGVPVKSCKDATQSDVIDCIKDYPPAATYHWLTYNCIDYVKEAARNCCLDCGSTWFR